MARRPDINCAHCGELMWSGTSSLPPGRATCRPCRRLLKPPRAIKARSESCRDCGAPKPSTRHTYCRRCGAARRIASGKGRDYTKRPTVAERGYGSAHRKARAEHLSRHTPGDPCSRCKQPMWDDVALLDLDHTDDRAGYLGLSHRRCNRATASNCVARPRYNHSCEWCCAQFISRYESQRFCSVPCRRANDADAKAKRTEARRKQVEPTPCRTCGFPCLTKECSDPCRVERNRQNMRNRYRKQVGIPLEAPKYSRAA